MDFSEKNRSNTDNNRTGKGQNRQLDTPEKTTGMNTEDNKSEAPKKKKNIIRVYHAQNASDGGKNRKKPLSIKV